MTPEIEIDLSDLIEQERTNVTSVSRVRSDLRKNTPTTIPYSVCGLPEPKKTAQEPVIPELQEKPMSAELLRIMSADVEKHPLIPVEIWAEINMMYTKRKCAEVMEQNHLQYIHTPFSLCEEVIRANFAYAGIRPSNVVGVFCCVEMVVVLVYIMNHPMENIIFFDDAIDTSRNDGRIKSSKGMILKKRLGFPEGNYHNLSQFEDIMKNSRITTIIGNPPYQEKKDGNKTANSGLWQNIMLNVGANAGAGVIVSMIHPAGWRSSEGGYIKTRNLYNSWDMKYLNINSLEEGSKVFHAATRFDWYVAKTQPYQGSTVVNDENGFETVVDLRDYAIIPNSFEVDVNKWIGGTEKCNYGYSAGAYHSQRKNMSKVKSDEHKYPCVMNVGVKNTPTSIWFSNENKGMFGIPKAIFGRFGKGVFIDYAGEYGCTEDCAYIAAPVEELEKIRDALQSEEFQKAAIATYVGSTGSVYDRKFMKQLRKDFWK